jgi:AcrR family transcriptional regulator
MTKLAAPAAETPNLNYNLLGQRLGRKGRGTRDRILAATERLLTQPQNTPLTLSAVAREASLAMTTIYLYFSDFTELLLAVLDPITASAEDSYIVRLRQRWTDDDLGANCTAFIEAFHAFWQRNALALHLRNTYSVTDQRMVQHRIALAKPVIELLIEQMDGDPDDRDPLRSGLATALVTGMERLVTVATAADLVDPPRPNVPNMLLGQARLLELGIRDGRAN